MATVLATDLTFYSWNDRHSLVKSNVEVISHGMY
jgi:hypothetical protein